MKIVADSFDNAAQVLEELMEFQQVAVHMAENTAPYSVAGAGRPMPRFIKETAMQINGLLIKDIKAAFPSLNLVISNGVLDDNAVARLNDALYVFGDAQQILFKGKGVILKDNERVAVYNKLCQVVGDLCIFIGIQYRLFALAGGQVPMSVSARCERLGITADVMWGLLLQDMQRFGQTWYAWEILSPLYNDLVAFDPGLVAECEDAFFPLTEEVAESVVSGKVDPSVIRTQLAAWLSQTKEREVEVTPANMMAKMRLE